MDNDDSHLFEHPGYQYQYCKSCGENRIAAPSGYASASPTTLESCKCNAEYAGSDGSQIDHSAESD